MLFELAASIRRHLYSFGRRKLMGKRRECRSRRRSLGVVSRRPFNAGNCVFFRGRAEFTYSIHVLHQRAGGRARKRIGCVLWNKKPRERALIFIPLWVWWWYNTCFKFFMPDETQYVGYMRHWTDATLKSVTRLHISLFPWQNYTSVSRFCLLSGCRPPLHLGVT